MEDKNPWGIEESREVYENNWIQLTEYDVINPAGGYGIYGKVHFKNLAIGIIPLDQDRNTWLVGQYRFPTNTYSWEIPEGGGPFDEEPLEAAKRELAEETGLRAAHWQEIQRMQLSNSVTDEESVIYIATGLTAGTAEPEDTEALTVRKVKFEEAYQMVLDGQITDSMSVAGILKTHILIQENKI